MQEVIEQLVWLLEVYFWVLKEMVAIVFEALGVQADARLATAGIVIIFIISLMFMLKLVFGNLGSIIRMAGLALYVLVLTLAYNRLLAGG